MATLAHNEELLVSIDSLLRQMHAKQVELALKIDRLDAAFKEMKSEMSSNYVGFEGWAREIAASNNQA
jgi:hypothetical protein